MDPTKKSFTGEAEGHPRPQCLIWAWAKVSLHSRPRRKCTIVLGWRFSASSHGGPHSRQSTWLLAVVWGVRVAGKGGLLWIAHPPPGRCRRSGWSVGHPASEFQCWCFRRCQRQCQVVSQPATVSHCECMCRCKRHCFTSQEGVGRSLPPYRIVSACACMCM